MSDTIRSIIQSIARGEMFNEELYSIVGTVVSIDENERTCDVEPIDEPEACVFRARFQASLDSQSGIFIKPVLNSKVVVTFINKSTGFISLFTEIDEILIDVDNDITINGGDNGGLIKINELITQLNKNSAILSSIQSAFNSWIVSPSDGGAALKVLSTQFTQLQTADLSNIENEKIKH